MCKTFNFVVCTAILFGIWQFRHVYIWHWLWESPVCTIDSFSVLTLIKHCLNYYSFIVSPDIWQYKSPALFFKITLGILGPSYFCINFTISLSIYTHIHTQTHTHTHGDLFIILTNSTFRSGSSDTPGTMARHFLHPAPSVEMLTSPNLASLSPQDPASVSFIGVFPSFKFCLLQSSVGVLFVCCCCS